MRLVLGFSCFVVRWGAGQSGIVDSSLGPHHVQLEAQLVGHSLNDGHNHTLPATDPSAFEHSLNDGHIHSPPVSDPSAFEHSLDDGHGHIPPDSGSSPTQEGREVPTWKADRVAEKQKAADERRTEKEMAKEAKEREKQRVYDLSHPLEAAERAATPEASEWGELPRLQAHPKGISGFCSEHFLGMHACPQCSIPAIRHKTEQLMNATGPGHSPFRSTHLLYLHAQKTGGSTLECATQGNALQWRWSNMGHTGQKAVAACLDQCTIGGVKPRVVVMVRDPYAFWGSRFTFAYECVQAASCTRWYGITSFLEFLQFVERRGNFPDDRGRSPWEPQSFIMREQCGQPCKHDFLFHTETMQEDWLTLMDKMGEPRTLLPVNVNPTRGRHPPIEFGREALDIIHRIDSNMFNEFGFKKRQEPFKLDATELDY